MEVLISVVDRGTAEDCLRRGDIIVIKPDGWGWSDIELSNPNWRIISTNILQSTAEAFLARSNIETVKRRRGWMIDFSLLPDPSLFFGARAQPIITLTRAKIAAAAVKKP